MYDNTSNTDLGTLGVHLKTDYGYKMNEPSTFDQGLTGNDLYSIMQLINHWYGKSRSNKNLSGNRTLFKNFDSGWGWLYFFHLRLTEIDDTDMMNATSSDDPDIPSDIPVVTTTTTTTPTPTKVDVQKEKAATSLVEKNTAASSLIKLQKEYLTMKVSQMLAKHYEELEGKLFKMKEELHQLEVRLLCTSNSQSQVFPFQ